MTWILEAIARTGVQLTLLKIKFKWTGYKKMAKHFKDSEVQGLNEKLIAMLDAAREAAGVPIIITSGYRSPEHNSTVGGVEDSSHTSGLAVDVRCPNDQYGKQVAFGLGQAGFARAGFYDKHIHVDIDTRKPSPARWSGESH